MLKENYEKVKENIVRACEKAGRSSRYDRILLDGHSMKEGELIYQ